MVLNANLDNLWPPGNGYEAAGAKQSVKVDGVKVTAGEGVATPAG